MRPGTTRPCFALALTLGLFGCNDAPPDAPASEPATGSGADVRIAPGEHQWTTADGNQVPYVVAGEGDVTVMLIHCWMCDRTFWSEQIPVLADQYRTIAIDLPGHGEATASRTAWSVSGYGEDVAGMLEELGLDDVVLVGHSMGGPVSLRAAALTRDRVRGIVAVDTLHNADFEFSGEEIEQFMAAFETDYVGTCSNFVEQMFIEEGSVGSMNRVRETSCTEQRAPTGIALMKDFTRIDMPRWFSEAGVPIRAINAAGPTETRVDINRRYADFDVVYMEDVGHYLQMTRPGQFNPLLMQAIQDILADTA
jgi:sigma-B regulation protein RsbQ